MYGAKWVGNIFSPNTTALTRKFLVKAATTITKGDWITIEDATGKIDPATTGEILLGVANETVTGNSGGTNTCEIIPARPGDLFLMDNDNDTNTFAQTDVGEFHDMTGATSAQQIDTSTGVTTTAQLLALEYNPQGYEGGIYDDDTSIGLYSVAEGYFGTSF